MTYEQLDDALDDDLAWRKREITELLFKAKESDSKVLYKSLILLLYAHWEGYVKKSSKLYVRFVADRKIQLKNLTENFKAVAVKGVINKCMESKDTLTLSNELKFIQKYTEFEEKKFKNKINPDDNSDKSIIDTGSNLNAEVYKNIHDVIGISYKSALEIRASYIDNNLLSIRNSIGHGNKYEGGERDVLPLNSEEITRLKDVIFTLLDSYRDDLLEYANQDFYLKSKGENKKIYDSEKENELENKLKEFDS